MSFIRYAPLAVLCAVPFFGAADCGLGGNGLCDFETDPNCEDPARAQVEGTITVPQASNSAVFQRVDGALAKQLKHAMNDARAASAEPHKLARSLPQQSTHNRVPPAKTKNTRFRSGEAVVRALEPVAQRKAEFARQLEFYLSDVFMPVHVDVRLCGTEYRCLADITNANGKKLDQMATAEAAIWLSRAPFLKYAEKNLILQMELEPNDEFFTLQWHYAAIDLPAAWDITTGDPARVAAIIDTGVLYDHPDLTDRVPGHGADLIDDPTVANDGDGRDMDGYDAGDNECGDGCNSFHGSHVSGTIGATTDNGTMVAGITWDGVILPVRVLGVGGGSLADIADGIEWATGHHVDGVDDNATPADVINMSLGGSGQSDAMDEAVADAIATGCIVAVAAGNDDQDASTSTPANSPGAIVVAAHGNTGPSQQTPKKASYSNFGDLVTLAAPGGEQSEDLDGDGQGDGVLSTVDKSVVYYQGTSMATPHVAGVAMLLKSLNPDLNQDDVRQILTASAGQDLDCPEGCGAGRLSAVGALLQSQGSLAGAHVIASPSFLRVGKGQTETPVVFKDLGTAATSVTLDIGGANRTACTIDSQGGNIDAKGQIAANVTIARNADANDSGECDITATASEGSSTARVVWTPDNIVPLESVDVGAVQVAKDGSLKVTRLVTTTKLENFEYKLFNLDPGTYLVVGLVDTNNNGSYDDDVDAVGIFTPSTSSDGTACTSDTASTCGRVTVKAGDKITGADFVVAPGFTPGDGGTGGTGTSGIGDACAASSDCGGGLYCETTLPEGYCTLACQSDPDCGSAAICDSLQAATGEVYQVCLKTCTADADCRGPTYSCDPSDNTCFPL